MGICTAAVAICTVFFGDGFVTLAISFFVVALLLLFFLLLLVVTEVLFGCVVAIAAVVVVVVVIVVSRFSFLSFSLSCVSYWGSDFIDFEDNI